MTLLRRSVLIALILLPALTARAGAVIPLSNFIILSGGTVTVGGGTQVTGLTGSSFVPGASQTSILVAGAASITGDARSMGKVQLNNGATISGTVYHPVGTVVTLGSGASVGGQVLGDPELPPFPAETVFGSGGTSYTGLPNGTILPLVPNSYGTVNLGGACTINLSSGNYYFDELTSGNGLKLKIDLGGGPVNIYVTGKASFGSVDVILTNGGSAPMIYLETHGSGPAGFNAFTGGGGSDWLGRVYASRGGIHFGGSGCCSTFLGQFLSTQQVDLEHAVTGTPLTTKVHVSSWGRLRESYR